MASRATRGHRQASAWPLREPPVYQRRAQADAELEAMIVEIDGDEFHTKMSAAYADVSAEVAGLLFGLTDQAIEELDPDTMTRGVVAKGDRWTYGTTTSGDLAVLREKSRRQKLTAHQRMAEIRERRRRRATP